MSGKHEYQTVESSSIEQFDSNIRSFESNNSDVQREKYN